jgi:hypothetical protein
LFAILSAVTENGVLTNQRGTSKALIGSFEDKMSAFFYVQTQGSRFDSSFPDDNFYRLRRSHDQN